VVVLVVLAVAAFRDGSAQDTTTASPSPGGTSGSTDSGVAPTTLRLVATGDMIAHDAILKEGRRADGSYDFSGMLTNMKPYFERADVRFCNQATPAGGVEFGISGYPTFNAPIEWARAIEGVGCNLINLGTNHTNDKGQAVINATAAAWEARPGVLAVAGANRSVEDQQMISYFTTNGVRFAFLTYITYNNNPGTSYGVNTYDPATATAQIAEARTKADIVIVSMRWGVEDSPTVSAAQKTQAQQLADAGADIVLGHGPHVLQPVDALKGGDGRNTVVWYSLGNFLNSQLPIDALIGGFATIDIDVTTKSVKALAFLPVYSHYEWTPEQKAAHDLLARHDFGMYALDKAQAPMARSLNDTTVDGQIARVKEVLNRNTRVDVLTSEQYLAR
jgi:poly-gamma-glutamate capsule biosynthesis protein CapA/YwtB (metallophosphatase superfamily)